MHYVAHIFLFFFKHVQKIPISSEYKIRGKFKQRAKSKADKHEHMWLGIILPIILLQQHYLPKLLCQEKITEIRKMENTQNEWSSCLEKKERNLTMERGG